MKTIDSVQEYIKIVLEMKKQKDGDLIFRGHASKDYELKPSIGRKDYSEEKEMKVFMDFKKQYFSYTSERPETDMDILFLAQHYGLPTRLLDWSYNPMIALYFACESHDEVDGAIYSLSLSEYKLADSEDYSQAPQTMSEIMKMENNMYVVPKYTDARYKNQKALFLLCNKPYKKFTFAKPTFIVKKDYKKIILHDLAILGYDKTLIYPLLDSLCQDIKFKNGLA